MRTREGPSAQHGLLGKGTQAAMISDSKERSEPGATAGDMSSAAEGHNPAPSGKASRINYDCRSSPVTQIHKAISAFPKRNAHSYFMEAAQAPRRGIY